MKARPPAAVQVQERLTLLLGSIVEPVRFISPAVVLPVSVPPVDTVPDTVTGVYTLASPTSSFLDTEPEDTGSWRLPFTQPVPLPAPAIVPLAVRTLPLPVVILPLVKVSVPGTVRLPGRVIGAWIVRFCGTPEPADAPAKLLSPPESAPLSSEERADPEMQKPAWKGGLKHRPRSRNEGV